MATNWDDYWTARLNDEWWRSRLACNLPMSPVLEVVARLGNPSPWRSVLVVGCGISTEPAAIAHAGYEVVAFDVSQVAVTYVMSHPPTPEQLWFWLQATAAVDGSGAPVISRDHEPDLATVLRLLDARRRAGGALVTLRSDFREFTIGRQFDIVYSPCSWQCLESAARAELARRAFAWVSPGGMCLLATINLRKDDEAILHHEFSAAGFFEYGAQGRAYRRGCHQPDFTSDDERQRWWKTFITRCDELELDDRRHALARLAAGEKMYDTFNGSG